MLPLTVLAVACDRSSEEFTILFEVRIDNKSSDCAGGSATLAMTDFRMFIHDLRIDGKIVRFVDDRFWQSREVALLDAENGHANCRDGTARHSVTIRLRGQAPVAPGLTFSIGVPDNLNHGNPMTAAPPLSFTDMHWTWRSGYRFLRAGIRADRADGDDPDNDAGQQAFLHLGSAGCEGTIGDIRGCRFSNRPQVKLDSFVAGRDMVVIDLDVLLSGAMEGGRFTSCSSGPDEASCAVMLDALGIDPANGESERPAAAFRSVPKQ